MSSGFNICLHSAFILLLLFTPWVFCWSLSDSKYPQVSSTLLSILDNLNNEVVWMVDTRPIISISSSPYINPLVTVPRASISIGINVTFMFHSFFFQFPSKIEVFILLFHFLSILLCGQPEQHSPQFCMFFFFCCWLLSGLVVWPGLGDLSVCQNPRRVCTCHSPGQMMGCANTISISCTIPCGSLCPTSRVYSYTLSVLISCIRWLWDWWFCLCYHITYNFWFVAFFTLI